MYFRYFVIISPWKRAGPFIWTNLNPLPKDALCHVWLKLTQWSLKRLFLNVDKVFCSFVIISPWKRAWHFIRTNLNPLPSRMLCDKFDWIWSSSSGEEDENVTSLQTVRYTNQQQTTRDQKSSFELSVQVRLKVQLLQDLLNPRPTDCKHEL